MTVCERIDEELKKRGLSRRQLAIKAGIAPSSFQSAMQRNKDISLDMLFKISDVLEIPITYLLGEPEMDQEEADAFFNSIDESEKSADLIQSELVALNSEGLKLAREMVELIGSVEKYVEPEYWEARKLRESAKRIRKQPIQSTEEAPTPDTEKQNSKEG